MARTLLLATLALLGIAAGAHAASPPAALPPATFQAVAREVLVPMDDGVRIAATVTLPSRDGRTALPGPFPLVLATTPYGRNGVCGCLPAALFATRGIAAVVADVRGTGGSEGTLEGNYFSPREARDGARLIEHFAVQPWSSGRVGMAGGSYLGITQYLAAAQRPPHLAAIVPMVALSDLYRDGFAHGGVPNLSFDVQYIGVQGAPGYAGTNTDPALLVQGLQAKLGQSPPGAIAADYLKRPDDDVFYRERSPIEQAGRIDVPALVVGNWQDGLLRGQPEMFRVLARRRGVETRLHMGPCTHKGCGAPFAPLTDPPGQADVEALVFEFLDRHLRGAATPDRPAVDVYLQGAGRYVAAAKWPPGGTRFRRFHLGAGTLRSGEPGPRATRSYVADPAAGLSMALHRYGTVAATPFVPLDQRLAGPHGLTFRTAALPRGLRLTGPAALHLAASSTATDTDWHARLSDVAPDGTETFITDGALRASHREQDPARTTRSRPFHTHVRPRPVEPGREYAFAIEIWPTAWELARGHRLQLRLTSTDLPTHRPGSLRLDDRDPSRTTLEVQPPAVNTVRLGDSHLLLPVGAGGG